MKKIAYMRPDGGLSIVNPSPKHLIEKVLGPLTDIEYEAHVRERSIPADATNVRDIDDEDLPADRDFRNAWGLAEGVKAIQVNPTKAKEDYLKRLPGVLMALDAQARKVEIMGDDASTLRLRIAQLQASKNALVALDPKSIADVKAVVLDVRDV